jgi:hypothetical protein
MEWGRIEKICQEWAVGICKKREGDYDPNSYPVDCKGCKKAHTTTTISLPDSTALKRLLLNKTYH